MTNQSALYRYFLFTGQWFCLYKIYFYAIDLVIFDINIHVQNRTLCRLYDKIKTTILTSISAVVNANAVSTVGSGSGGGSNGASSSATGAAGSGGGVAGSSGSGSTSAGGPTAAENVDLHSLFECPVCFDFALPPIMQCQSGHIVCAACRAKLTTCPNCRGPLGELVFFYFLNSYVEHKNNACTYFRLMSIIKN